MRIYLKNIPAKFHPDPIWNYGALGFWRGRPNKNKNNDELLSEISSSSKNRHYLMKLWSYEIWWLTFWTTDKWP